MTPRLQKFALLAHISFSVGWFGAVVPYLALAIARFTRVIGYDRAGLGKPSGAVTVLRTLIVTV